MATISSVLIECLKRFNDLTTLNSFQEHPSEVSKDLWKDELGRLRVWAANIGAHQTGQSSVDYRLRDASNIKDQVIRLLTALLRAFDDLEDVLDESEAAPDDDEEEEDVLDDIRGWEKEIILRRDGLSLKERHTTQFSYKSTKQFHFENKA